MAALSLASIVDNLINNNNNNNSNNNNTYLYRIRLFSTSKILLSIRVLFKETVDKVKNLKAKILYNLHTKLRLSILRLKFTKEDSFCRSDDNPLKITAL